MAPLTIAPVEGEIGRGDLATWDENGFRVEGKIAPCPKCQRSAVARWYGDRMPDVRDDVLTFAWHAA